MLLVHIVYTVYTSITVWEKGVVPWEEGVWDSNVGQKNEGGACVGEKKNSTGT